MFIIPQVGQLIRRAALVTQAVTTGLVFVVLLTFTIISWQNAHQTLNAQKSQVVDEQLDIVEDAIGRRMATNGMLLRGGAGIFDASEAVTRSEWQRFYAQFDVNAQFDGVSAVGYVPVISASERASFEGNMRADGIPDYTIQTTGDTDKLAPVMYAESFVDASPSFGFDMYAEPTRRTAMDRARDTGTVVMTNSLKLSNGADPGIVLYAPVYTRGASVGTVEERQAALRGYVYVSLRTSDLFANVQASDNKDTGFAVYESAAGGANKQIYNSFEGESGRPENFSEVRAADLALYGQTWQVSLLANENIVSETENERPSTILAGGVAISLIASLAVFLLIQYRTRSFALAEEHRLQQAKDELLSLASHQLRTPATGVKQYIGMVLDGFGGDVPKDQEQLLEQAYKSNERQLQIINEFLYVAKLGSGSLTTTVHTFDLVPVVNDVLDEMQGEIKDKAHKLTVTMPKQCIVNADEHSVRMIIENLLSNAIKYTHPEGTIIVALLRSPQDVRFRVDDSGVGIARRDLPLLFKQFSRIPNELSNEVSGSGIGLYLAQQLAIRNGGKITVESEPEEGSSFMLHLPVKSVKKLTKIKGKK